MSITISDFGNNIEGLSVDETKEMLSRQYRGKHVTLKARNEHGLIKCFQVSVRGDGVAMATHAKKLFNWKLLNKNAE